MHVGGLLRAIVPVWSDQPFFLVFSVNFRLNKASTPSKLNQAELEIVVMTPTAMAKAANTVWLAPVEEIVRFYVEALMSFAVPSLNTTSSEGAGTASELGISADTLGVLTAIVCGREQAASSKLFRLGCGRLSFVIRRDRQTI